MRHFISTILLWIGTTLMGSDLCGPADTQICLANSTVLNINGAGVLGPGTTVIFSVPGVSSTSTTTVDGTAEQPYRIGVTGTATDNQGGTWHAAEALAQDDLGATAIRFTLTAGQLTDPISISIQDINVCQRIIDGPRTVDITVALWGASGKRTKVAQRRFGKLEPGDFSMCSDSSGSLPVPEENVSLFIINPGEEAAAIALDDEILRIEPGQQVRLDAVHAADLHQFGSSLSLPVVAFSDEGDFNVTELGPTDTAEWFLPHLARDSASWRNRWIFANGETTTISWRRYERSESTTHASGNHQALLETPADAQSSWARIVANRPLNGFLAFDRNDGGGGAWVSGQRPLQGKMGSNTLYLPHVAADTENFWTGYSLANPYDVPVNVTMHGYNSAGQTIVVEERQIPEGGNDVQVIGAGVFQDVEDLSWIVMTADQPISGIELVGTLSRGSVSGFSLPEAGQSRLAFPLVRTGGETWTGLAMVNTGDTPQNTTVVWRDAEGGEVKREDFIIEPYVKVLRVAPDGALHAQVTGENLLGFCLNGGNDGRLGGYLGITY